MLSRVAENVYWMARYVERAENLSHLINISTNLLMDLPRGAKVDWNSLLEMTGSAELFQSLYKEADERSVVRFLLANEKNPSSILSALSAARENLRTTRDIIPAEAFENINNLYHHAKENVSGAIPRRGRYSFLRKIIEGSHLNSGLLANSMLHDDGYAFLRIGRSLERADMTTRILDVRPESLISVADELVPFQSLQWMSILKSLTAYQMYRRDTNRHVQRREVLKFILANENFPRSVLYCLQATGGFLEKLPRCDPAVSAIEHVKSAVFELDVREMEFDQLRKFLDDLQIGIADVHSQIAKTYF